MLSFFLLTNNNCFHSSPLKRESIVSLPCAGFFFSGTTCRNKILVKVDAITLLKNLQHFVVELVSDQLSTSVWAGKLRYNHLSS